MRVISGDLRGFRLKSPEGLSTRPTSDRIKESLFSIINSIKYISGNEKVLDLYSGSGGIGIEFLSRGVKEGYFVDIDKNSIRIIKENIEKCKLTERSYIYRNDARKAINALESRSIKFDFIFLDPPYKVTEIVDTINYIFEKDILSQNGLIILESEKNLVLENVNDSLEMLLERNYGITKIAVFKKVVKD